MDIDSRHLAVFIYNLGILVTGMGLQGTGRPNLTVVTAPFLVFLAAGWTVYFYWKLAPQFLKIDDEDDEADGDQPAPMQE